MPEPILDNEDLETIDGALQEIEDLQENLVRAEQAGIDVSRQRQRLENDRSQLRAIRQAFFPGVGP